MIIDSAAPADVSVTDDKWLRKLAVIAVMTVLADWLLFRRTVGISLVLFVIALEIGVLVASPARPARRKMLAAAAILLAALLPFVEAPSVIAFFFCLAGAAYFAVVGSARATGPLRERAAASLWLLVAGPFQTVPDINRAYRSAQRGGLATSVANVVVGWTVPLVLGAIFVWLFVSANPVIELWFKDWSRACSARPPSCAP